MEGKQKQSDNTNIPTSVVSNNINQLSLLAAWKIIIIENFSNTTAHAFPNIIRNENIILKVIWTLCLLGSTAYCIKSMVVSLQDFLEYPSYISTTVVQEIPTEFPAVTLCNLKYVNKTFSAPIFADPRFLQIVIPPNFYNTTWEYIRAQTFLAKSTLSGNVFTDDERDAIGYKMSDMLLSCTFNFQPCSASDFVYSYHTLYGHCYTFNKGVDQNGTAVPTKTVALTGNMYGLVMELFLGKPDDETIFEYRDGIAISIHNKSQLPFTEDVKKMAPVGAETDFIVSRNFITKLEAPYSGNCTDTSKKTKYISYYSDYIVNTLGVSYTQSHCFGLCVQKQIMNKCSCSNIYFPTYKDYKDFCDTIPRSECMFDVIYNFANRPTADECKNACPFECESIEYETQTFRSSYPADYYKDILLDYSNLKYSGLNKTDDISKTVAKVNVYYKNMLYTKTEEKIQTSTEDFFSNMGGTLGLYIGISLLSLIELVELVFNMVIALITIKKAKNQNQIKPTSSFTSPSTNFTDQSLVQSKDPFV